MPIPVVAIAMMRCVGVLGRLLFSHGRVRARDDESYSLAHSAAFAVPSCEHGWQAASCNAVVEYFLSSFF